MQLEPQLLERVKSTNFIYTWVLRRLKYLPSEKEFELACVSYTRLLSAEYT